MCGGIVLKAIKKAKKVIVVDPRRIWPAKHADHWLQLRPGTDGALALAMLNVIIEEDLIDHNFVENYTVGFESLCEHVREYTPEWAAPITRITTEEIRNASRTYALSGPACIQWGNAIDHGASNFHTARSLLILRAITGNLDRPGGDVVWDLPRGVRAKNSFINPKWAGSKLLPREKKNRNVDGNLYPVLGGTSHPPTFWRSIVNGDPYRIRALWIMGSNPLVTMTHSLEVEKALSMIEYIIASDFFLTPTTQFADLFLPASTWLEYDEVVQMGGLQWCVHARRKVCQVGDTKDDQEVIIQVARRLGLKEAFPWENHRALCDWMLEETGMNFDEFAREGLLVSERKYYKYKTEDKFFKTPSGKFEIFSPYCEKMGVSPLPIYREPPRSPLSTPDLAQEYPLILTSGAKIPFFFHSEFRQIDSLRKKHPDPLVEIHPETAFSLGIVDGDWVWIETPEGRIKQRARIFDGLPRDVVSAQHAWWFPEEAPPEYGWKKSSINLLHGDMGYDPDTGSESLRSALCKIYKV
jgi:anaerobic selenocysteine-containing dehydrogenase